MTVSRPKVQYHAGLDQLEVCIQPGPYQKMSGDRFLTLLVCPTSTTPVGFELSGVRFLLTSWLTLHPLGDPCRVRTLLELARTIQEAFYLHDVLGLDAGAQGPMDPGLGNIYTTCLALAQDSAVAHTILPNKLTGQAANQ